MDDAPRIDPDRPHRRIGMYVAGFLGGACLCIGDLLTNDTAATVLKFQAVIAKYLMPSIQNGGLVGVLVVGALGALFCWIWPVATRGEAFARGFSVFAILAVGTPYSAIQGEVNDPRQRVSPVAAKPAPARTSGFPGLATRAHAAEFLEGAAALKSASGRPNAEVVAHSPVSSCKPSYWGPLGLGSLFNNSLKWCQTDHWIAPGSKVEILACWDTGFRHYRYVQVVYAWKGAATVGWISSGKRPDHWRFVRPADEARLPASCRGQTST